VVGVLRFPYRSKGRCRLQKSLPQLADQLGENSGQANGRKAKRNENQAGQSLLFRQTSLTEFSADCNQ
jgi:hypothetical protein